MQNKGLDLKKELEAQDGSEWIFGAVDIPDIALVPEAERENYLPLGEVQRGTEDMMDCASRSVINILETKFNWLLRNKKLSFVNETWLRANGYIEYGYVTFSDAFVAINSGTTRSGNSLKAPLDAVRKQGLVPKSRLPLIPSMTFDEYHNPARITEELRVLGEEFNQRFKINYQKVYEASYGELLREDLLNVAGFAWSSPIDGIYYRVDYDPNHAFMIFKRKYFAFDNYEETSGDFIKQLSPDYNFLDYGYRVVINNEIVTPLKKSPLARLGAWLRGWWAEILR